MLIFGEWAEHREDCILTRCQRVPHSPGRHHHHCYLDVQREQVQGGDLMFGSVRVPDCMPQLIF